MARTIVDQTFPVTKLRYRLKKGAGKHYHGVGGGRKCYMAGDIIEIDHIGQLGQAMNKFEPVDGTPTPQEAVAQQERAEQAILPNPTLKPIHRGGGRWFVLNTETEEFLNDAPLTKAEAFALAGL